MKVKNIFTLVLLALFLQSCGLIYYTIAFSPTKTWYFKIDFKKKVLSKKNNCKKGNVINTSDKAIRLVRQTENKKVYCYWVDIDTMYLDNNRIDVLLKIVNEHGKIERFLGGWLSGKSLEKFDLDKCYLQETKKGDLAFVFKDKKLFLEHLGDEMGLHHKKIIRPKNISEKSSLSMIFEGYDYIYSWIEIQEQTENKFKIYKYSYSGELIDTIMTEATEKTKIKLTDNYFLDDRYDLFVIYDNGRKYYLKIKKDG